MKVLAISYGRQLFVEGNPERQRMLSCATAVTEYHMIVFSLRSHELQKQQIDNLHLYPTHSRSRLHMLFDAYRIGKQLLQTKTDWVITTQDPFEAGLVGLWLAQKTKAPLNVQEHGDFYSSPYWARDRLLNRIRAVLGRFVLKRADTVRAVSKRIKQALVHLGVPSEKISLLPVRSDQVTVDVEGDSLRSQFPDASLIVLTMGRLVTQKNIPLIINAFAALYKKDAHARLVILGEGSELSKLKNIVETHGLHDSVSCMAWSDDPQSIMGQADIYAHAANWEGWGRVFIEAMSAGVPIVTTDVGAAGEVLINGRHGLVVPVADQAAFTEKLLTLADNKELRQRLGNAGKEAVADWHMSEQDYAHAWTKALETTLNAKV